MVGAMGEGGGTGVRAMIVWGEMDKLKVASMVNRVQQLEATGPECCCRSCTWAFNVVRRNWTACATKCQRSRPT